MAVTPITSGLSQVIGVKYTVRTDSSADWGAVSNDVYFYDVASDLAYYKNSNGTVSALIKKTDSVASVSALDIDSNNTDISEITAQAVALTINAPTGLGRRLVIRIKDDGTARSITFNSIFRGIGITLPTTTTASKTLYIGLIYNTADTKWDVIALKEEA